MARLFVIQTMVKNSATMVWALAIAFAFADGALAADERDRGPTAPSGAVRAELPAVHRLPIVADRSPELRAGNERTFATADASRRDSLPQIASRVVSDVHRSVGVSEVSPVGSGPTIEVPEAAVSPSTFPYAPAPTNLSARLLPAVQGAYALAQRGAIAAARTEFIQVLRRIAQAKDAAHGTGLHSQALAEGLRALDEAQDFVPAGAQLEAELNVAIVSSSHRTPVVRERDDKLLPHQAVALYHTYAEQRLTIAVDGEQAGSMALYGLGKAHARAAERDDDLHAMRCAMTMYLAALGACPTNHLASNELGVLLYRNGHAGEAAKRFEQAINLAPTSTNYHNLAIAQQKIGLSGPAAANEAESQRLATLERARGDRSRRAGVEWVTPQAMSGIAPGNELASLGTIAPSPDGPAPQIVGAKPLPRSPWQRTKDFASSLPFIGRESDIPPQTESPVAETAPDTANPTFWR